MILFNYRVPLNTFFPIPGPMSPHVLLLRKPPREVHALPNRALDNSSLFEVHVLSEDPEDASLSDPIGFVFTSRSRVRCLGTALFAFTEIARHAPPEPLLSLRLKPHFFLYTSNPPASLVLLPGIEDRLQDFLTAI